MLESHQEAATVLIGSEHQVEWAERIRTRVAEEFARVAAAFGSVADKQGEEKRTETAAILDILEDKRVEVMRRREAGYFIHDWQEIGDQVRQMIGRDARYQAILAQRASRLDVASGKELGRV